jgi:hypothetical protein
MLSLPLAAQDDSPAVLAGSWTLNLAKSKVDPKYPVKSQTVEISYTEPTIKFHYMTDGKPLDLIYTVDGKEHDAPGPAMRNMESIIKATWKKGMLYTESISRMGMVGTQTDSLMLGAHWSVSEDGKVLTEKTGSDFGGGHLYTFDKQ